MELQRNSMLRSGMNRFLWPLLIFGALAAFLALGLQRGPRDLHSPLVGRPAPNFSLPALSASPESASPGFFSPDQMRGKVWLLNVWASWCDSCHEEHPLLVAMKGKVALIGMNHREIRGDAKSVGKKFEPDAERRLANARANVWLERNGDPYALSVLDIDGHVGIDYGVYGVPETFVIDKNGVIRFRHVGPITQGVLAERILPLVDSLSR